jgi:hypothetical protein
VAYNLDGGHCSFMEMNGKVVNDPYKPEHEIEDGILLRRDLYEDIKHNKKNSPACLCCMQPGFHNSKNPGLV